MFRLLLDRRGVGRVHVQQPRLTVVTRPDGSNVEDALGTWLSQLPTQPGTDGVELDLELAEGVINVSQTHGMTTMTIDDVQSVAQVVQHKVARVSAECVGTRR